ncbi:hypothetical protein CC78DRAFT_480518, partial [Lojkania enalia]
LISFFTKYKLRRLYRRFNYSYIEQLYIILKNTIYNVNPSILKKIEKFCYIY